MSDLEFVQDVASRLGVGFMCRDLTLSQICTTMLSLMHGRVPASVEIMKVELEGPVEFHGNMVGTIMQRRGMIAGSSEDDGFSRVTAEVPLAMMFGYSTALRSATQGKAEFTMEFAKYDQVPANVSKELIEKHQAELKNKKK